MAEPFICHGEGVDSQPPSVQSWWRFVPAPRPACQLCLPHRRLSGLLQVTVWLRGEDERCGSQPGLCPGGGEKRGAGSSPATPSQEPGPGRCNGTGMNGVTHKNTVWHARRPAPHSHPVGCNPATWGQGSCCAVTRPPIRPPPGPSQRGAAAGQSRCRRPPRPQSSSWTRSSSSSDFSLSSAAVILPSWSRSWFRNMSPMVFSGSCPGSRRPLPSCT